MAEQAGAEDDAEAFEKLRRECEELQARCEFLEELVGPVETQRKLYQQQLLTARSAALRARHRGVNVPTRWVGRLDERLLQARGLSKRERALLQGGCVEGSEGITQDVSLLGDPLFKPYDGETMQPLWEASGGSLRLTLGDVRDRWGEDVALEVVRCAIELDKHDASRRIGIELPWHAGEQRELCPSEVIYIMEQEVHAQAEDQLPAEPDDDAGSDFRTLDEELADRFATLGLFDGLPDHAAYEWSLTDADVEQLLSPAAKHRAGAADSPDRDGPDDDFFDGLDEEMLLELLEADVIDAANLCATTPDLAGRAD